MGKGATDFSFYIGYVLKNDERRDKSHCIYFHHTQGRDGNCAIKGCHCIGSSHCDCYKTQEDKHSTTVIHTPTIEIKPTLPTPKEILVGAEIYSPQKELGKIVDVQRQVLYVNLYSEAPETIHKVGFKALTNPSMGRWTAKDDLINRYILYLLKNNICVM